MLLFGVVIAVVFGDKWANYLLLFICRYRWCASGCISARTLVLGVATATEP